MIRLGVGNWRLGVVLMTTVACSSGQNLPPQITVDRTPCSHCGMLISEPMDAAAYKAPRVEGRVFDDIGCLLASAKREAGRGELRFWFHDAATGDWMSGAEATFVKSDRFRTPMSGGLVAYRSIAVSQRAAAEHAGRVVGGLKNLLTENGL